MAFAEDKTTPYLLNQSVRTAFFASHGAKTDWSASRRGQSELKLTDVARASDWWTWVMTSFLDVTYWETWYNGQTTETDVGTMVSFRHFVCPPYCYSSHSWIPT
jgi:hypothetical protein